MTDESQAMQNTDRELWREREGDYYADSIHVTERGGIGINCGGFVIVMPVKSWHALASAQRKLVEVPIQIAQAGTLARIREGLYPSHVGDAPHITVEDGQFLLQLRDEWVARFNKLPEIVERTENRVRDEIAAETPPRPDRLDDLEAIMARRKLFLSQPIVASVDLAVQLISKDIYDMFAEVERMRAVHQTMLTNYEQAIAAQCESTATRAEQAEAELERLRAVGPRPEAQKAIDAFINATERYRIHSTLFPDEPIEIESEFIAAREALRAVGVPADEKKEK